MNNKRDPENSPENPSTRGFEKDLVRNDPAHEFEKMLQDEQAEVKSECWMSESKLKKMLSPLIDQLSQFEPVITQLQKDMTTLRTEMERLKTDEQVLTNMQAYCEKLSEQQYEREVLIPLLRSLISVADRCRQQVARFTLTLRKYCGQENHKTAIPALRTLIEARNADRIEIEDLLANYGTEPFEQPEETFDPSCQKCIHRIKCEDPNQEGQIAERILPGYRRDQKVVRPEYVNVYVISQPPRKEV